ncbi:nitrate reductase molybdenum cofactor assembly chaperone [Amphibiibacter pelophylacis]|uniref:Nitrate reductase molybdenum cofactor assembly chaperone n=1 Tax=Amphibiibacter pelophylacis TaxID=1799477 RepID=A0ACC6P1D4_9BURK
MNTSYRLLSVLLDYPGQELLDAEGEIRAALQQLPALAGPLEPLLGFLYREGHSLIDLQENYTATFDRNPGHALHLFEHIHGESRDRGQAMVDLLQEYQRHGFEPAMAELPDHVPLFLEFLSLVPEAEASGLLGDAIHVLAGIGERLARNESPYAAVFTALRSLTDVVPQPPEVAPVRDMDEAMETFGPGVDGIEPLLKPGHAAGGLHPVQFHPRSARPARPAHAQGSMT